MTKSKMRSLGTMEFPSIHVEKFNGRDGLVTIALETHNKRLKVKMCVDGVRKLTLLTRDVVARLRAHVMNQWNNYKSLASYTGYTNPND